MPNSLACACSVTRPTPAPRFTRAAFGLFALVAMLGAIALASLLTGCVYRGAKIVEGTDLAVGINVPSTEGALQLQMLNYLSGFRLAIAENAALTMTYTTAESNDYFGVIHTRTAKQVEATVSPTETSEVGARVPCAPSAAPAVLPVAAPSATPTETTPTTTP